MFLVFLLKFTFVEMLNAKTIELKFQNYQYRLVVNQNKISFRDQTTDLNLESKKCNDYIIKNSHKLIENFLSHPFNDQYYSEYIKFEIDNKAYFESPNTSRAAFFLQFQKFIKSKKIEEDLSCSK
jgi:hypothetical protein